MPSDSGFRIETLHAFTSIDDDDVEGVIAFRADSGWMPMIAADPKRLEQLRPLAHRHAVAYGKPVKLSTFTVRTDVETFDP